MSDLSSLVPLLVALIAGGGGVALYTARAKKGQTVVETVETAVSVFTSSIARLEADLAAARERIAVLEAAQDSAQQAHADCERHLREMTDLLQANVRVDP